MKSIRPAILAVVFAVWLPAQNDRGTITGTVTDPVGAVVANAHVKAVNSETGAVFDTLSTSTGNYTIAQLPLGEYVLTVEVPGFSRFVQEGIRVFASATLRVDVALKLGGANESITVTADASLLQTESAELSTTLPVEKLDTLPLNFGASVRSFITLTTLIPSGISNGTTSIRLNGLPTNTFSVHLEGQEANNARNIGRQDQVEPSVESLQEVSVQSSNFSAEFGQVGGGYFNLVVKSGTNRFHGSLFEYFVNEDLGAGQPFTNSGNGHLLRPQNRKNDFGGTVGGPVWIPRLYNGRNKTFFFFSYEAFLLKSTATSLSTVPTAAMRNGDFSQALTGRNLGADPLGNPINENTIYDPLTPAPAPGGQIVTRAFPGNVVPISRMDPVAMKIQSYIPTPTYPGVLLNNFVQNVPTDTVETIPTIKIDQNLSSSKLSFYWSQYYGPHNNYGDGLPLPITGQHRINSLTNTFRLNYDKPVTPTLLIHAGAGFLRHVNPDQAEPGSINFNQVSQLGLNGSLTGLGFPDITGLSSGNGGGLARSIGAGGGPIVFNKPTAVGSAALVRDNHTFKLGAEWRLDELTTLNLGGLNQGGNGGGLIALNGVYASPYGTYLFSNAQTGLPYTQGQTINGATVGLPYASFLLGAVNQAAIENPSDTQARKPSISLYVQDTWKITHKLTLDYGLRWDYQPYPHELHDRSSEFSPNTPNPSAGGIPGAIVYEGNGPGTCNCNFTRTYPYAIGPRLGISWQALPRTVFRAGWGVTYFQTATGQSILPATIGTGGWNTIQFTNPAYGSPALQLSQGLQYNPATLYAVNYNTGILPAPGQIGTPPNWVDPNGGRPARLAQWDISIQREITTNLLLEAAYVGNRGAWFENDNLINMNAISYPRLAADGININSPTDLALLTMPLSSAQVQARGFKTPYPGFPATSTLAQALRPFPQFGAIAAQGAGLADSWYDALQMKMTKRLSHGLDVLGTFVWQKELGTTEGAINDVFNRPNQKDISSNSLPLVTVVAFTYRLPGVGPHRWIREVVRDWTLTGNVRYASGLPILAPAATNNLSSVLFQGTFANRVPGQPLFLQNLNCGCIDPNKEFALNPAAWSQPAPGQFGVSAPYYSDYRQGRTPGEQAGVGRIFHIREKTTFQIRAEFFNVLNRTYLNQPSSTNAQATPLRNAAGAPTSGFGYINSGSVLMPPRTGQIVGRIEF